VEKSLTNLHGVFQEVPRPFSVGHQLQVHVPCAGVSEREGIRMSTMGHRALHVNGFKLGCRERLDCTHLPTEPRWLGGKGRRFDNHDWVDDNSTASKDHLG